ncbi:hypothetical protein CTAYLR_002692 [Chrysophaeum taylorii]|uniref:Uncharacterized protein n=1 Tax=Chrysophaeum taylorii TaxID=2483200 RepID=A0AAD7XKU9_9STRA|nr:hypothetical protein CTAYLR_002692 [Chrysophaeum taylorii]
MAVTKMLLLSMGVATAFLAAPHLPPATTQLRATSLSEAEVKKLLSGSEFAMDISSITAGSEKETYIGQGSGVNEGAGLGGLIPWLKKSVGKVLAWKNRPVYDKLWRVIEEDVLATCDERFGLVAAPTWFDNQTKPYEFSSEDGKCTGTVAAYRGGNIDWITTCKFFSSALGFGNMRIDGWLDRSTRAPHMAVHLCIVFNVLFIYINLVPRTNLVLDDDYNDYVYGDPKKSAGDRSLNDIQNECIDDKAFKPYFSKSHVVKAFMNAPTTLLYTVGYSNKNFAKVRQIAMDYVRVWLDMAQENEGVLVKNIDSRDVQTELLQTDVRIRQFCGRDPDTKNVANILGLDTTDKLVRTLWGDPNDPIWASR